MHAKLSMSNLLCSQNERARATEKNSPNKAERAAYRVTERKNSLRHTKENK